MRRQLALAASAGASAVCLNARVLGADGLGGMLAAAAGLGLDAAVEVHDAAEAAAAVAAGAKIVGVSNRDPATWALTTPVDFVTRELVRPINETVPYTPTATRSRPARPRPPRRSATPARRRDRRGSRPGSFKKHGTGPRWPDAAGWVGEGGDANGLRGETGEGWGTGV